MHYPLSGNSKKFLSKNTTASKQILKPLLYLIAVQMLEPVVPTLNSTIRNQELLLLNLIRRLRIIWQKTLKNNSLENIEVINKAVWINNNGIDLGIDDADASSIHLQ